MFENKETVSREAVSVDDEKVDVQYAGMGNANEGVQNMMQTVMMANILGELKEINEKLDRLEE